MGFFERLGDIIKPKGRAEEKSAENAKKEKIYRLQVRINEVEENIASGIDIERNQKLLKELRDDLFALEYGGKENNDAELGDKQER